MKKNIFEIFGPEGKIVFIKNKNHYGYQIYTKQLVTAPDNPLIFGPNFNLWPEKIKPINSKTLSLTGRQKAFSTHGEEIFYFWQGQVSLLDCGWFKFEIELNLKKDVLINQKDSLEPKIVLQLPSISVQEEGSFIWNQVLISNPVVDNFGIQSSDLPASYYYDPLTQTELMFFLDWQSLSWTSNQNLFGFLGGKCGLNSILTQDKNQPLRERFFGFWPENPSYLGKVFPKGEQSFVYYFHIRQLKDQPNEWQALSRLIKKLNFLLVGSVNKKAKKFYWQNLTEKLLTELQTPQISQIKLKEYEYGLSAYGKIGSFRSHNPPGRIELMTQIDVLWPLYFYNQLYPQQKNEIFFNDLIKLLPKFYDPEKNFIANWYPFENKLLSQDEESWYFLENGLIKFGWLALLTKDENLKNIFFSFCQKIIKVAEEHYYLFPLRYNWKTEKDVGCRKNYIAGGLFSYGMYLAYKLSLIKDYLYQAKKALELVHQLPLDWLFHEPQELGFAAATALALSKEFKLIKFKKLAWGFICQQLRMFYWYTDKTLLKSLGCDCAGMVRSFPSKIYPVVKQNPAFKENIEAILPWTLLLDEPEFVEPLIKFLNLARGNNLYFFEEYQGLKNPSAIPLESLPALRESGLRHQGGGVGHSIYGSGELIWLHLLFESKAISSDKEIMVISLDYLKPELLLKEEQEENLLIYNPTFQKKNFKLLIKKAASGKFKIWLNRKELACSRLPKEIDLALPAQAWEYVKISQG